MAVLLAAAIEDFPLLEIFKALLAMYLRLSRFLLTPYGLAAVAFLSIALQPQWLPRLPQPRK